MTGLSIWLAAVAMISVLRVHDSGLQSPSAVAETMSPDALARLKSGIAQASGKPPASLAGRWRVVGVGIPDGIGALAPDDPSYMGKELTIAKDHIWWEGVDYHDTASPLTDICFGPFIHQASAQAMAGDLADYADSLRDLKVKPQAAYSIRCIKGDWGPAGDDGSVVFTIDGNTLLMPWYDGGLLKLARRS